MHRPEWCRANMKPFPWILQLCAFLLLCALATTTKGSSIEASGASTRIIGGHETESLAVAPHMVSLRRNYRKKSHFCGGSIIADRWILTAAHCTTGFIPETMIAVVGTLRLDSGGDVYEIEKIVSHKYYMPSLIRNDIALLKIKGEFRKDRNYAPIALCTEWTAENVQLRLTGWGLKSFPGYVSHVLMSLNTTSISNEECLLRFFGTEFPRISIGKNMCVVNEKGWGSCQGDSGGGLVDVKNKCVSGIVSWGVPCAQDMPDMYTRVSAYQNWISENLKI